MSQSRNQNLSSNLLSFSPGNMEKININSGIHTQLRHADQPKTPFELIMGESPKAIPEVFENTKFPSV